MRAETSKQGGPSALDPLRIEISSNLLGLVPGFTRSGEETFYSPNAKERKTMTGRHRRARTGMTTRQKQMLRAGTVAIPISAGFMLASSTIASAADPVPLSDVFGKLQQSGGFPTYDPSSFTYNPTLENAPKVASPSGDIKTDCTNAANSGTPCTIDGGEIDKSRSFPVTQRSQDFFGGNKVTIGDWQTQSVTHPTTDTLWEVNGKAGVKTGGTLSVGIPLVAEGKATGEVSGELGGKYGATYKGEVIQDQQTHKTDFEFSPGPNGAHMENRDNTAQYVGEVTAQGQDSEGNPVPVQIDDGVEYQRTQNTASALAVNNDPPSRPAPLSGQQQPEQSQQQPQALPPSYWEQPSGPQPELGTDWSSVPGGGQESRVPFAGWSDSGSIGEELNVAFQGVQNLFGFGNDGQQEQQQPPVAQAQPTPEYGGNTGDGSANGGSGGSSDGMGGSW